MHRFALLVLASFLSSGCSGAPREGAPHAITKDKTGTTTPNASASASGRDTTPVKTAEAEPAGDAVNGAKLVLEFECNRCHDGTGHPAMAQEKHCTHCHEDISTGRFGAGTPRIGEWRKSVAPYRYTPSLEAIGKRFRRAWVANFLKNPYDLRPHLAATMPRLPVTDAQAADIAAYLTRGANSADDVTGDSGGDPSKGRSIVEAKGCGSCHEFTGARALPTRPNPASAGERLRKAIQLAPDLRHARERFRRDGIVEWLLSPASVKPDTEMPSHALTRDEARDVAAFVMKTDLPSVPPPPKAVRLPLLSRRVTYHEVEEHVLRVTCRHCHTDPDAAGGDGGPGNTGGFGFHPRGLDLSTYGSAAAGYIDDRGERRSVFSKNDDGVPILVAALLARHTEESGSSTAAARGMPLGLPSVSPEDIQLVDTWIAQGRPR